MDASLI